MSTSLRVTSFAAGLAAVFALAFGLGRAVGPLDSDTRPDHVEHEQAGEHR